MIYYSMVRTGAYFTLPGLKAVVKVAAIAYFLLSKFATNKLKYFRARSWR